jgi:hypothetical protein
VHDWTRRDALQIGGLMAAGGFLPADAGASSPEASIDFADRDEAFRARIKTLGSLADEDVFRLSTGHIYGLIPGQPVFPLCNIENYSVSRWRRQPDGNFQFTLWEVGVHTDRDTGEPLKTLLNPVTNQVVEVIPYRVGPLVATITPDGIVTPGTERTVQPQALRPRVFDGYVWYPFESPVTLPNPLPADRYPEASTGATFSWHTVLVFAARLADVTDPARQWVPALSNYTECLSWQPWLQMGQRPGVMLTRGYGKKFGPEAKLPASIRRKLEQTVPEILDRDNWTQRRNEFSDYMEWRKRAEAAASDRNKPGGK